MPFCIFFYDADGFCVAGVRWHLCDFTLVIHVLELWQLACEDILTSCIKSSWCWMVLCLLFHYYRRDCKLNDHMHLIPLTEEKRLFSFDSTLVTHLWLAPFYWLESSHLCAYFAFLFWFDGSKGEALYSSVAEWVIQAKLLFL